MSASTPPLDSQVLACLQLMQTAKQRAAGAAEPEGLSLHDAFCCGCAFQHERDKKVIDTLAFFVRRLVYFINKSKAKAPDTCELAHEYLRKEGLMGSPLREESPQLQ